MSEFPLSKAPDGLLGTLDLKSLGKNPQELDSTLSPSIEILPFYLLRNRLTWSSSGPFAAVQATILFAANPPYVAVGAAVPVFIVPQLEVLRIKSIGVFNTRAAADAALTLQVEVFLRRANVAVSVCIGVAIFGPHPATDLTQSQCPPLTEPLWLGPGDRLSLVPSTTQTVAGSAIGLQLDFDSVPSG